MSAKFIRTKVITAQLPESLADKVDQLAARQARSRAWIVKEALAAWVEKEEERRRLTLEAMEDVDAGRVIDQQAILEWAEHLDSDAPLPPPLR